MMHALAHELLNLVSIRALQRRETINIKRLEKMRSMRRHTESDDLVFLTLSIKFGRGMAAMPVDDKKAIIPSRTSLRMSIEMFDSLNPIFVSCPAI
jgi:hypothetical protein